MKNKKGQEVGLGIGIFVVVLFVGFVLLVMGFDKVEANHMGVKVRLGEITGTMDAGLQWTGILTSTKQYDMRIRQAKVEMLGEESATDNTGQIVFGSVSVNYKLKREGQVVEGLWANVGTDDVISQILNIEPIIKEGFKQATVQYEAIEILQNRQDVKELAIDNIRNNFPNDYFDIVDIVVENIDFTDEYKAAIEAKKIATQNRLKEEINVETVRFQQAQQLEIYKADAEKLRLQKSEITSLLNEQKLIDSWNGVLPSTLIISDGTQGLFLQLAKGDITSSSTNNTGVVQ